MPYTAPVGDHTFILDHVLAYARLAATDLFAEATRDMAGQILAEAGRLARDVIAPVNRAGDTVPAHLENGVVRSSPGFAAAHRAIAEGGWIGMAAAPTQGGMGLPMVLTSAVNEMFAGACMSLHLGPLLTQGQIEALDHHASDAIKAIYLPRLISGEWSGTMDLTEPGAGSDVGALTTRAEPLGEGRFAVTGQKIFISWGDSDLVENVCHLVLARLPGAPAGTRGISLFLVPKYIPDGEGRVGAANGVHVVSLEHKLGLHGSPTAMMAFDAATGWLVGEAQGGMAAMFTMMNTARLGVAMQGVGIAEAATQAALAYARDRRQGRTPQGSGPIADHADVRRMLATMRALTFAARCIALDCALAGDLSRASGEGAARAAFLTPIAKAFATDIGHEVAQIGLQVHGGMGVIEETGAAQYARDVRVAAIYEGTNGIQAMDLVGRKMGDGGAAAFDLIEEMQDLAEAARAALPDLAHDLWSATETLREATEILVGQDTSDRNAGAVPYLRAFALILGGAHHLRAALAVGEGSGRAALAAFYIRRLMPEHAAHLAHAREGASGLYAIGPEIIAA